MAPICSMARRYTEIPDECGNTHACDRPLTQLPCPYEFVEPGDAPYCPIMEFDCRADPRLKPDGPAIANIIIVLNRLVAGGE